jgi:hypothetical protein
MERRIMIGNIIRHIEDIGLIPFLYKLILVNG